MDKIIILGDGGHAKSLVDAIERSNKYEIVGYVINESINIDKNRQYPIVGNDSDLEKIFSQGVTKAAIGIGFLGKSNLRNRLYDKLKKIGFSFPVICDPSAVVSSDVVIEEGTFIGKGAILNASAHIGKMCIINTGAIIEHDCNVGEFSHIAVGSVLCGGVNIGCSSFVGANATVIQEKSIGNNCIIGAGEVARKNMDNDNMFINNRILSRMRY